MNNQILLLTLKSARIRAGYTQVQVAERLGVNVNTIISWEKDSSNLRNNSMNSLSKLYKVPKNNIFFGVENEFIRTMKTTT